MLKKNIQRVILLSFLLFFCSMVYSKDDYLTKIEFFTILSKSFSFNKLEKIYDQIPDNIYIWGYDIGDFSSDGFEDIAFSFEVIGEKSKNVHIKFYINDSDSLRIIYDNYLKYYDLPIEIGFIIQNSECNITQKISQNDWVITSYSYIDGQLKITNIYESKEQIIKGTRRKFVGYEKNHNYKLNTIIESYYQIENGRQYFERRTFDFSSYKISHNKINPFYSQSAIDTNSMFITSGYLNWKGCDDLSLSFNLFHDDSILHLFYYIEDDTVLFGNNRSDQLVIWIDRKPDKIIYGKSDGIYVREGIDEFINKINIFFDNRVVNYCLNSNKEIDSMSNNEFLVRYEKIIKNYYFLNIEIPISFLKSKTVGFGWEYYDYDNSNDQPTIMSSGRVEAWNPSTFGVLNIIDTVFKKDINPKIKEIFDLINKYGI